MTPTVLLGGRSLSPEEAAALDIAVISRCGITTATLRSAIESAVALDRHAAPRPAPPWHSAAFLEPNELDQSAAEFVVSGEGRVALLTSRGRALSVCQRAGVPLSRVFMLEAEEILPAILGLRVTEAPDFDAMVRRLYDAIHAHFGGGRFRIHADLVSTLVAVRRPAWALALEYAWQKLFKTTHVSTMCGYRLTDMRSGAGWSWIPDLAARHTFAVG
jgi:hypothetical protein